MKPALLKFGLRLATITFIISFVISLIITFQSGFHPGLWAVTAGLFFSILTFKELLKQSS